MNLTAVTATAEGDGNMKIRPEKLQIVWEFLFCFHTAVGALWVCDQMQNYKLSYLPF